MPRRTASQQSRRLKCSTRVLAVYDQPRRFDASRWPTSKWPPGFPVFAAGVPVMNVDDLVPADRSRSDKEPGMSVDARSAAVLADSVEAAAYSDLFAAASASLKARL